MMRIWRMGGLANTLQPPTTNPGPGPFLFIRNVSRLGPECRDDIPYIWMRRSKSCHYCKPPLNGSSLSLFIFRSEDGRADNHIWLHNRNSKHIPKF